MQNGKQKAGLRGLSANHGGQRSYLHFSVFFISIFSFSILHFHF